MIDLVALNRTGPFKRMEADDLLFVEYVCPSPNAQAGIWSDHNYFAFCTSGRKMWRSLDEEYVVEAGNALFVKKGANIVHQYFEEKYCALMVFIPDEFIRRFTHRFAEITSRAEPVSTDSVIRVDWDDHLQGYVNSLAAYFASPAVPDKQLLLLKFEELLLNIFTRPHHRALAGYMSGLSDGRTSDLKQVMEANYTYALKLEEFARMCGLSLSSFKRSFQETFNMAPGKWISGKRLERAARLLELTDKHVNEVAYDIGYEEPSSFIRAFKQRFGTTPQGYRMTLA
ncbi:MAG: AraC family transcriptional regulator [Planctomycetaceae bacterium]